LMSESLVGRAVASTRQKAGSVIDTDVRTPPSAPTGAVGGVNGPAATAVADLIVTFGIVNAARFARAVPADAADAATCATAAAARAAENARARRRDMGTPPGQAYYTGHDAPPIRPTATFNGPAGAHGACRPGAGCRYVLRLARRQDPLHRRRTGRAGRADPRLFLVA